MGSGASYGSPPVCLIKTSLSTATAVGPWTSMLPRSKWQKLRRSGVWGQLQDILIIWGQIYLYYVCTVIYIIQTLCANACSSTETACAALGTGLACHAVHVCRNTVLRWALVKLLLSDCAKLNDQPLSLFNMVRKDIYKCIYTHICKYVYAYTLGTLAQPHWWWNWY